MPRSLLVGLHIVTALLTVQVLLSMLFYKPIWIVNHLNGQREAVDFLRSSLISELHF